MGTQWDLLFFSAGIWDFSCLFITGNEMFLNATGTENIFFRQRLRLGFQYILLIGMGFRNKLRWENRIGTHTPSPTPPLKTLDVQHSIIHAVPSMLT